ncbi:MAG: hypothetical protein OXG37_03535 [Actinomycetia bacterium]|nr:hypothetical protein [Actinomycetes bacterium]
MSERQRFFHQVGEKEYSYCNFTIREGDGHFQVHGLGKRFKLARSLEEAKTAIDDVEDTFDRHFQITTTIDEHYRKRDTEPDALRIAIEACKDLIAMAERAAASFRFQYTRPLPGHKGYEQLAIIREKQKDYKSAIELSQKAKKQGWAGDWDRRIVRCRRRMEKKDTNI